VGEFREDCASQPMPVDGSERLYLGFRFEHARPYVAEIRLSAPPDPNTCCQWLEIPWEGKLRWGFNEFGCLVQHGAQSSPDFH
jgi:hypothetical protein